MIGLLCKEKYDAMTKYNDRDDDGENNKKKDGNNDDNATSGSGPDVTIFDPIMTPRSSGG